MPDTIEKNDESLQLVTFKVGREEFSVPILKVQEIIRMADITRVPNAPEFVEGVINLRGKVIPVLDLRKRFGLPKAEKDGESRIIVVDSSSKAVGLIVDSVSEVLRLSWSTVEPPPSIMAGIESEYIDGVGKLENRLVILINLDKVLTAKGKKYTRRDRNSQGEGAPAGDDSGCIAPWETFGHWIFR